MKRGVSARGFNSLVRISKELLERRNSGSGL
jgi:hypothetical protein